MRFLSLTMVLILSACSSTQDKKSEGSVSDITNESFKKERALSNNEVSDFYAGNAKALSPALQDETLARFTEDEVREMSGSKDPLTSMALLCSQGKFDQAFATASKAFNSYQKVAAYWNQVANCHLTQGSTRKALLFYNKALEVSKNYVPALNNIGVLYSRTGQDQKALIAFEKASSYGKFAKTPRYNLGKLYLTYGLTDKALAIFEGLLQGSPNDVDLLNSVASAYFIQGDYQRAAATYQRIPNSLWSNPEIGLNLAYTLKKLGREKDAVKVFNSVSKTKSPELKRYYSVVKSQLGGEG